MRQTRKCLWLQTSNCDFCKAKGTTVTRVWERRRTHRVLDFIKQLYFCTKEEDNQVKTVKTVEHIAPRNPFPCLGSALEGAGGAAGGAGRGVPHGRARALEVARLALVEDVLQLGAGDGPEQRVHVRGVVVLPDHSLAELIPCGNR